ncbi:BnaC01g28550D [Brassica napus]|uniref:BnaC01g28550D protein n=1 Tax=Brassica napus TaxID=3708 RepID=A0A078H6C6_BRANA|nr:BnaC01g28550D [Brassica napus]
MKLKPTRTKKTNLTKELLTQRRRSELIKSVSGLRVCPSYGNVTLSI